MNYMETICFCNNDTQGTGLEPQCSIPLVKQHNGTLNGIGQPGIFFTINPSDHYWSGLADGLEENHFRSDLIDAFDKMCKYYRKKKELMLDVHIHFEKVNGRVHSHGIIVGELEQYAPYEGELKRMSQFHHKIFGKPRLNSGICADFRWTNDNWDGTYLVKQNYMNPCRIVYKRF